MNRRVKVYILVTSIIVLVISVITYVYINNLPPIPRSITSQLNFAPAVAGTQKTISKPTSISFDQTSKILSYQQTFQNTVLQISQQAVPEQYIDFPESLKTSAQQAGLETQVSANGTDLFVVNKQGTQTGVLIKNGALVQIQPAQNLSAEQWQEFLKNL